MSEGELLTGDGVTQGIVRIGDTVRRAAVASTAGPRSTVPDQRAHRPFEPGAVTWPASRRRCRRLSTRIPKTPSSAGIKVTAAATVNATVSAEATARPFRKLS